ncbi:phospholipid scramblase 2-like [Littorina saxatilis]|uniref:phospholipid scramblase 2-like n=1 Tax=Littorina saxatilis TaxID=31220 RepID=UPI0038B588C9
MADQGPPPQDGYGAPPPGQYGAPPPGQYGAPPPGQYGAPPQGQYGAPPPGSYGMQPVMAQPGPGGQQQNWMPAPTGITGCPPGLEYLSQLDQVICKQETSMMELLTGWEAKNKFRILNSLGQQIYFATEESDMCQRQCCGPQRGFIYHFSDNNNQEVFRVKREFECCNGVVCCPCTGCRYMATCEDRNGQILGYVSNLQFCCSPHFAIYDENQAMVGEVKGPCCPCQNMCCTDDINFEITDLQTNSSMGTIKKVWEGAIKDMFTDSDNFSVLFPINTEVKKKALMIGMVFIIDMMMYEKQQNSN